MKFIEIENLSVDIHLVKSAQIDGTTLVIRYKDNTTETKTYENIEEVKKNFNLLMEELRKEDQISTGTITFTR